VDAAVTFRFLRELRGPRAGIVGGGGGYSVLASDEVGSHGLEMPALPEETQQLLRDFTPAAGTSVRNPIDTSVGWGPDGLKPMLETIRIVAGAPNIDYVLYHTSWGWGPNRAGMPDLVGIATETAEKLGELAQETGKPIVCVARAPNSDIGMSATLAFQHGAAQRGLPTYSSMHSAALSLKRLLAWQRQRETQVAAK
jgi:acyl-CoA synthetase (NDP forming)